MLRSDTCSAAGVRSGSLTTTGRKGPVETSPHHGANIATGSLHGPWPAGPAAATRNQYRLAAHHRVHRRRLSSSPWRSCGTPVPRHPQPVRSGTGGRPDPTCQDRSALPANSLAAACRSVGAGNTLGGVRSARTLNPALSIFALSPPLAVCTARARLRPATHQTPPCHRLGWWFWTWRFRALSAHPCRSPTIYPWPPATARSAGPDWDSSDCRPTPARRCNRRGFCLARPSRPNPVLLCSCFFFLRPEEVHTSSARFAT
jgi:hypothetical protein